MNTQPTQPVETQQQEAPPPQIPQQKTTSNTALWAIVILLLLVIVGGGAYLFGSGKLGTLVSSPTPTLTPTTTVPEISETPILTASPSVSITQKAKPTISPNLDGNTFTSDKLGIAFYWANKTPADQSATVKVLESGSRVYVYPSSGSAESGQFIERFDKSPSDSLGQAITKRFLAGISTTDCFVKIDPKKPKPTLTKATIGYPIPADAIPPYFEYGQKCPEKYKESNGMAYFFEDSDFPDRFYWVSIGQYGIPAQNSKDEPLWQDTIVVF